MKDRLGHWGGALSHAFDEVDLVEVVADAALREVAVLVGVREVVDGDDVGDALAVEGEYVVAADEAGCAGNENAHDAVSCPKSSS